MDIDLQPSKLFSTRRTRGMMQRIIQFAWALSILLVVYLSLTRSIEIPCRIDGADILAHFAAYAWLGFLPFFGYKRMRTALIGAFSMAPFGIALEFAQRHVPGRDFSILDMGADIAGVALGIVAAINIKSKRSQVSGFGFQVEGKSDNSDRIRACRRICLAISVHSRAYSRAGSDECRLADGISIFRHE